MGALTALSPGNDSRTSSPVPSIFLERSSSPDATSLDAWHDSESPIPTQTAARPMLATPRARLVTVAGNTTSPTRRSRSKRSPSKPAVDGSPPVPKGVRFKPLDERTSEQPAQALPAMTTAQLLDHLKPSSRIKKPTNDTDFYVPHKSHYPFPIAVHHQLLGSFSFQILGMPKNIQPTTHTHTQTQKENAHKRHTSPARNRSHALQPLVLPNQPAVKKPGASGKKHFKRIQCDDDDVFGPLIIKKAKKDKPTTFSSFTCATAVCMTCGKKYVEIGRHFSAQALHGNDCASNLKYRELDLDSGEPIGEVELWVLDSGLR
ncbi:hypothetical protein EXIGLDRAFT_833244 [Exidia glandulosa HHB12029]|uniref:Uncharacterized protein n=1 Tax=Exidia glandulosa HHB12029 TaxID=1314781 RepID=A0A165KW07_EXIGL|nr:hypothetical protein EXIGLDRAFT_833244 [Exidia glandulosa HHB12029]